MLGKLMRGLRESLSNLSKDSDKDFLSTSTVMWMFVVVLALAITAFTTFSFQRLPTDLSVGMIATRDIKADRNYDIVDNEATQSYKEKASGEVLAVYDFDKGVAFAAVKRIKDAFDFAKEKVLEYSNARLGYKNKSYHLTDSEKEELRVAFSQKLGVEISAADWKLIPDEQFSNRFEDNLIMLVQSVLLKPIVSNEDFFKNEKDKGITLRTIEPAILKEGTTEEIKNFNDTTVKNFKIFMTVDEAKAWI